MENEQDLLEYILTKIEKGFENKALMASMIQPGVFHIYSNICKAEYFSFYRRDAELCIEQRLVGHGSIAVRFKLDLVSLLRVENILQGTKKAANTISPALLSRLTQDILGKEE